MDNSTSIKRVPARTVLAAVVAGGLLSVAGIAAADAPAGLTAGVDGDSVELQWSAYTFPVDCNGAESNGSRQIHARYTLDDGPFISVPGNVQALQTSWLVEELAEGAYEFSIRARCTVSGSGVWQSEWSAPAAAVVSLAPPCAGAPEVIAHATPTLLWPPNGKLVPVIVSGSVIPQANCTMPQSIHFMVDDEYGELSTDLASVALDDGTFEFLVDLEASRLGQDMDGRLYGIGIETDDQGGTSIQVVVPHDQRRR